LNSPDLPHQRTRTCIQRVALALLVAGCASAGPKVADNPPGAAGADAGGSGGASSDPEPNLSNKELVLLHELAPPTLPGPPTDATNAFADTPDAARFGQRLFFDPRFSGELLDGDNDGSATALGMKGQTGKVSCAGCHVPQDGFSDTRTLNTQVSLGSGWGMRRAPSLLDVGQSKLLMWDGRRDSFFGQVFGVLESEVEMNSSRLYAAQSVFANHRTQYESTFGAMPPLDDAQRFPALAPKTTGCRSLDRDNKCVGNHRGVPGDDAEFDGMASADQDAVTRVWVNVGKSLGAYERLLSCGSSPFDRWMQGDDAALSRAAQRGAGLFVGRAGCVSCHSGPYLSDEKFHNVGLKPAIVAVVFVDLNDPGASVGLQKVEADALNSKGAFSDGYDDRLPAAQGDEYVGAFRTPRLRCVAERPSFMHTAQLRSLAEVVSFFDRGGDNFGFPGKNELAPLNLTEREQADLVAFMQALTGPGPAAELLVPP
jgi:cytochrome c peroxidase